MIDSNGFYFKSYEEWREAITGRCNINVTKEYARGRISALQDTNSPQTKEFTSTYSDGYREQVIRWFEQAEKEA